jgi:hypothetical protein
MRSGTLLLLCFGSLTCLSAAAQQTAPPIAQRDLQAISVISQSLAAMALPASPALEALAQGTLTDSSGQANPITIETAGVNRVRHNVGTDFSFVSNAGTGFLILQGGRHQLAPWTAKYKRPEHLPSLSLMADYLNPNLQAQYVGLENVNGAPAHHLRLSMLPIDGTPVQIEDLTSEFHVWIDQSSLLVVKTRSFDFSPETPQNRSPVDIYFGNYQQQSGAQLPLHLIRYIAGQKNSDIVFTSISLTATNPDSDFQ